jgi:spore germination protein YaaH
MLSRALVAVLLAVCVAPQGGEQPRAAETGRTAAPAQAFETLFYLRNNDAAIRSFAENAEHISILGPQTFRIDAGGALRGGVDERILDIARDGNVRVMPLFLNPGFDQETAHALLDDTAARARAVRNLVDLAVEHDFWGWQFDMENIHASYRDRLTDFYREAAEALHAAGKTISIAVVPTDGSSGNDGFSAYMQENWRNSFDVAALAEIGDFVSWMTYAQHAGGTTPGPVAGLPWMRQMTEWALTQGVPPEKLSLGVPSYSDYWLPVYDDAGARVRGRDISFARAQELAAEAGAEWIWLPEQGVHYAFWQRNVTFDWLFLEEARSFGLKLDLLSEYPGLRGISVWVLGSEDPAIWELLAQRR